MPSVVIPDMSAPARAGQGMPPPPNMLDMGSRLLQMRGTALQNQGLQNELTKFNAQQAGARDFQGAINPLTGQLDQTALNRTLANDPTAALAAPGLSQQGLANVTTQLQNQGIEQDNAIRRLTYVGNSTGALLAKPGGADRGDVIDELTDAVKDGVMTPSEAAAVVPTIPQNGPQLQQWLKMHYAGAQRSIQALLPHVQVLDNGKYQIAYNSNPVAGPIGAVPGAGAVQNTLSPAQTAQPVTVPLGASGASGVTTLGQFNQAANGGPAPHIVATGPTTQQSSANQVAGTAQGHQAATMLDTTNVAQTRAALQSIQVELPTASGGPLSEAFRNVGAAIGELGISGMDQATAFDLMQKGQAQVVVSRVAEGMGVPTDGKMMAINAQTPGTHMTGTAAAVATGQIEGILSYQIARNKAAQGAGVIDNPAQAAQFNLKWQQRFPNASVFQFPYLPKAFQQKYWKSMSASEQRQFHDQLTDAATSGFITPDYINSK